MTRFPIHRPTEDAALRNVPASPVLPPLAALLDLLIVARAVHDRFGERHFGHLLDRYPETR